MNDFGNSLDVVKGALIYGRSPYIPLRYAPLVRSPRGAECKALWQFRYGETPARTARHFDIDISREVVMQNGDLPLLN